MKIIFLKSYIDLYSKNKIQIIRYWLKNKKVREVLKKRKIEPIDFVKEYASIILDYYLDIVKCKHNSNEFPIIDELLKFLKNKNLSSSEFFTLSVGFRNSLIEFTYDLKIANLQIEKEINYIFEENFYELLDTYTESIMQVKKELKEQESKLIKQSKSATMGEMISMIAHQWRQPLQAVSILTQKLPITKSIEGEISDELLNDVVEEINIQLEYMSKTIDDFRDFFLPEKAKENISISELINKSLEFVSFMLKTDSIEVNIDIKEDLIIFVHVNELIQVLINLIKNAKDAMQERKIKNKYLNISSYKNENYGIIEIEDNAGGIENDILSKIFEPYFSTKSDKNGTGLGLYMCKTIIEKHNNGLLSVINSKKGASFSIKIPLKTK